MNQNGDEKVCQLSSSYEVNPSLIHVGGNVIRRLKLQRKAAILCAQICSCLVLGSVISTSTNSEPLVGQIVLFSGPKCPGGWLPANGQFVSVTDYPELYAVIGDTYGQEVGLFELPDLQGRFPMGNPNVEKTPLGELGGAPLRAGNLPQHRHSLNGVTLSGSVIAVPNNGTTATPSDSYSLANSNRTAVYGSGVPSVALADGSVIVTGGLGSETGNNTSTGYDAGYPPYQVLNYCIASGGDTAPLIEVGLSFDASNNTLSLARVDYSGFDSPNNAVAECVAKGDLCLNAFGPEYFITRPNVRIRLVSDNACKAFEVLGDKVREGIIAGQNPYPAELRLTGVQIAFFKPDKSTVQWGDHYLAMREQLITQGKPSDSSFTYTTRTDANGRPGFLAVDILDERTLVFENRNTVAQDFQYRVEAQCGEGSNAYSVYFDPATRHSGRGGVSTY